MPQDLYMQLYQSRELPYTLAEFLRLPADHQNELKDTGGFIAGTLNGGRRRSSTVMSRSAITLDADSIPCDMFETLLNRVTGLGVQYCIYSTAKHSPAVPRVRVVIPFTRDVPADEYPFFARTVCQRLQPEMSWFDPVSAKPEQLMYYPSHCKDIAPVYYCSPFGMPLLDVDAWAALFPNWKDQSTWSLFPKEQDIPKRLAAKQKDPTEKDGAVGAFCRVYDVPGAMAKYICRGSTKKPPQKSATRSQAAARPAARYCMTMESSCTPTTPQTPQAGGWSTPLIWCGCISSAIWTMKQSRERRP